VGLANAGGAATERKLTKNKLSKLNQKKSHRFSLLKCPIFLLEIVTISFDVKYQVVLVFSNIYLVVFFSFSANLLCFITHVVSSLLFSILVFFLSR
jgi:hypothetical protein